MTAQSILYCLAGLHLSGIFLPHKILAQVGNYQANWSKINQYSPVENFESQGSYGWRLGLGLWQPSTGLDPYQTSPLQASQVHVSKGTPWPLDFGLTASRIDLPAASASSNPSTAWQFGGHLQWTIWEAFQRPSIAVRVSRMETNERDSFRLLRSDTVQIGSSFALFKYLSLSLALGQQWETLSRNAGQLSLLPGLKAEEHEKRLILSWGARLQLFSPFWALSAEQIHFEKGEYVRNIKLSVLL